MVPALRTLSLMALLGVAAGARAQPASASASARLRYERGAGTEGCPDEEALRNSVAARLGYDPFAEDAARTVRAKVESASGERVATVKLEAADGRILGERRLTSRAANCSELAAAMELAITIAIDPLVLTRPTPTPPPPLLRSSRSPRPRRPLRQSPRRMSATASGRWSGRSPRRSWHPPR